MSELHIVTNLNGSVTYNGHPTIYAALAAEDPDFLLVDFATRMQTVLSIGCELLLSYTPDSTNGRRVMTFDSSANTAAEISAPTTDLRNHYNQVQHFGYSVDEHDICVVFDINRCQDNEIVTLSMDELIFHRIVDSQYDIHGLHNYLVRQGLILPQDVLSYESFRY